MPRNRPPPKARKPTVRFGSGRFLRPPVPVPPVPVLTKKMKILANPQKSKKVQKSIQNQKITSPHHPKSKNNIAPPRQKERGDPWGPKGPQPSLFGGVGRCYSLILDGGGMLFFDFGWIFGLFLIFGGCPKFSFFPVPVPPVPVRCPVPPVPVPNRSGFRFPVRFASFL